MTDGRVRLLKLAERLFTGGAVSSAYIREHFGVSRATAQRDLIVLEASLPVCVNRDDTSNGAFLERKTLSLMKGKRT